MVRAMTQPVTLETSGPLGPGRLSGDLVVPADATGVVVFAHGSGSSRHSPRNRAVAEKLQDSGCATLLLDLLTPGEEEVDARTTELRFDIGLLADRLTTAVDRVAEWPNTRDRPVGLFGASTGAAAALVAAARRPDRVAAVVSRGGRPDLAGEALAAVRAPTLLVVGGHDTQVLQLNRQAAALLGGPHELSVVPGASHLFGEPGALAKVAELAAAWFREHLGGGGPRPATAQGGHFRPPEPVRRQPFM
ncbi:Alpha/beta hydrolase family protein [Streptoalloteichus tenebrarius]|uniref:Alpha/beta hydrolase family protein n=3 Tax=Streptoalloteichus tenebrarius (strain ATCC 17920 / DSM 40477 / JCM 4838 / CBS 697.72 / NBRC 16177 / NCIMB 11028 / NRRL B-12390 / A12253. 1 / ISP 5477) TaxID=1933 RepID=A0ABT1I431_STRSD|nr:Alpha/beta hydrolase family protein [Streptoalloteichus tenebrarius]BFF00748.1 dienelactone hydrolase family protein [Streptoalloteichus tenebrarius]